jgi:hypothetical protein
MVKRLWQCLLDALEEVCPPLAERESRETRMGGRERGKEGGREGGREEAEQRAELFLKLARQC